MFDFWKGANFRLKIKEVAGYRNYDDSRFEAPAPLLADDKKLEEIWNGEYSLKEVISDDKFKSYDALKAQLDKVLGNRPSPAPAQESEPVKAKPVARKVTAPVELPDDPEIEDADLAAFRSLAGDD